MPSLLKRPRPASILLTLLALAPVVAQAQMAASTGMTSTPPVITATDYAAGRATLTAPVDSGIILACGELEPYVNWPEFFQIPNFQYLTGFGETNSAMLILKRKGAPASTMMFVPTQNPLMARFV